MPHPLPTADLVERLVRAALPGSPVPGVRPADEGGEHSTWWIGIRYVMRLALDRDASVRQGREIALREMLRERLAVAVPVSVARGEWGGGGACEDSGCTFTLDTRLAGISAERRPVTTPGERDLTALLTGLRSVPTAEATALGLPAQPPRDLAVLHRAAAGAAQLLGTAPVMSPPDHLLRLPTTPVLLHNDLKGEHLMVTGEGRVGGVLDWADAALGDPAEDIAGLVISVGAAAAQRVTLAAGYPPSAFLRALHLARYDTLVRLADRLHGTDDSPLPLLRAQHARAWEGVGYPL